MGSDPSASPPRGRPRCGWLGWAACLAAWLPAWLPGCLAACLPGCLFASLPAKKYQNPGSQNVLPCKSSCLSSLERVPISCVYLVLTHGHLFRSKREAKVKSGVMSITKLPLVVDWWPVGNRLPKPVSNW